MIERIDEVIEGLSKEEAADVAAQCLMRLEPGRQPIELFTQLARLVRQSIVDVVPYRLSADGIQILLSRRPDTDPWWPGQWHLPGGVVLPSQPDDFSQVAIDILANDFGPTIASTGPAEPYANIMRRGIRGTEMVTLSHMSVEQTHSAVEPRDGAFFTPEQLMQGYLGSTLVVGHLENMRRALPAITIRELL